MLIKGGPANSGTRAHVGKKQGETLPAFWVCPQCKSENKGYWQNCFTKGCHERRPS